MVVFVEFGEEFVGVVGEFDFGWSGAVGPGESAGVGDFGLQKALAQQGVVGSAAEEQAVGVGIAALAPGGGPAALRSDSRRSFTAW